MFLTEKMLVDWNACDEGFAWWKKNGTKAVETTTQKLIKAQKLDWANWLISKSLSNDQKVQYAIFSAKLVLKIYENKYPSDLRPRKAIEAAENYLKVKGDAWAARDAAGDARDAAGDARDAAWAAGAAEAAWAAWAAGDAGDAGAAAWAAAGAAGGKMHLKCSLKVRLRISWKIVAKAIREKHNP